MTMANARELPLVRESPIVGMDATNVAEMNRVSQISWRDSMALGQMAVMATYHTILSKEDIKMPMHAMQRK